MNRKSKSSKQKKNDSSNGLKKSKLSYYFGQLKRVKVRPVFSVLPMGVHSMAAAQISSPSDFGGRQIAQNVPTPQYT